MDQIYIHIYDEKKKLLQRTEFNHYKFQEVLNLKIDNYVFANMRNMNLSNNYSNGNPLIQCQ